MKARTGAWEPSERYWRRPKIAGHGFNFIAEREIYPPHNMIILTLVETGWIGLLVLLATIGHLSGLGRWKMNGQNLILFVSIALPLFLILIESHALFSRRYFAIYLVMLAFASSVLFQPGKTDR